MKLKGLILTLLALGGTLQGSGLRLEPIKFGDMQNWYTRDIKESAIIGGDTKRLYEIAPTGHTTGNKAYRNLGGSPWATSNVYAKVSGVVKTSCAVTPATVNGKDKTELLTCPAGIKGDYSVPASVRNTISFFACCTRTELSRS